MTACVSGKITAPGRDVTKNTSRSVYRSYLTHMEDGQNLFFPPSIEFAAATKASQPAMQRPNINHGNCFENEQHRFEIINVRWDKDMYAPEAELYGERMVSIVGDSAAHAASQDHRKIICKPWQTEFGSCALWTCLEAAAPSDIALLKEFHVYAE